MRHASDRVVPYPTRSRTLLASRLSTFSPLTLDNSKSCIYLHYYRTLLQSVFHESTWRLAVLCSFLQPVAVPVKALVAKPSHRPSLVERALYFSLAERNFPTFALDLRTSLPVRTSTPNRSSPSCAFYLPLPVER